LGHLSISIATNTKFFDSAGNNIPKAYPKQTASWVAKSILLGYSQKEKENLSFETFPQYAIPFKILQVSKKRLWNLRISEV